MIDSETIDQALARGAIIVTGNARAARRLHLDYARHQRTFGHAAWPTPPIFDWRTWLNDLWQQWSFYHPDAPILLTSLQEAALWKTALGDDAHSVVSPDSLASLAQQAYALLCGFQAHAARREPWESPDAERFRHWAQSFDRTCEANAWLSSSRTEEYLAKHLTAAARDAGLTLPSELHLTGFDRITPAQQSFLTAMQERGTRIEIHHAASPCAQIRSIVAVSERAEVEACAHWLRRQLEANPEARLAVLCNNVEQRRGDIDRIFRRILTPEIELSPDAPSSRTVYEFTLGNPLATVPVVRAATLALQWLTEPLPQEGVSTLLLSGYLAASADEHLACTRADATLRKETTLTPLIPLTRVLNSSKTRNTLPEPVHQRLRDAFTFAANNRFATEHRLPAAWTELFRIALETTGWPGFRSADSVQFQAQRRWNKLLDDLALLDITPRPISAAQFLRLLALHAQQTLFAPESLDAPIQIMGPMESAGQHFDAVWFLGATDEQWPATGRVHPLIPLRIQRETGMPHADNDLELAQSVTRRILATTAHITFSRARHNKDGELRPSPILTALAPEENVPYTVTNISNPAESLEYWQESAPIPYPVSAATGGATLLRDQAACPFRAFAAHRLHTAEIAEAEWGLTPMDRGILLHDVLHRFWSESEPRRIATRDDLRHAISEDALLSILEHHIREAFHANLPRDISEPWLVAYLKSEKDRLKTLLITWLAQESQRQPFTVEACEKSLPNVSVGPLQLKLQTDRIDLLPGGSRLLIDYKTGKVTAAAWSGNRPDEPQLPLYAVHGNVENLSGLLFAQIRTQDTKFIGHLRDAHTQLDPELKENDPLVKYPYTDSMHDQWLAALNHLANEFANGEARIQPQHGEKTCAHCPLPGLCRIHELNANAEHSLWEIADTSDDEQEDEDA